MCWVPMAATFSEETRRKYEIVADLLIKSGLSRSLGEVGHFRTISPSSARRNHAQHSPVPRQLLRPRPAARRCTLFRRRIGNRLRLRERPRAPVSSVRAALAPDPRPLHAHPGRPAVAKKVISLIVAPGPAAGGVAP